jgi:hypothetical protein
MSLPVSERTESQTKTFTKIFEDPGRVGVKRRITATVRHDDTYHNGHNTFSITGEIEWCDERGKWREESGGCIHEDISEHFPELAPLIKWHLCSADGPMHYLSNVTYFAGDLDCYGGRKGDVRHYMYNVRINGALVLDVGEHTHQLLKKEAAEAMVRRIGGEIVPVPWIVHEGKERNLQVARNAAIWQDATDEELSAERHVLLAKLQERLPALMEEFKKAVEGLGFIY